MNNLIFQLHTPEEFRMLSSTAHWMAGYIFIGVVIVAFLQSLGFFKTKTYLWPLLVAFAGLIFIPFTLMHHGVSELPLVWKVLQLDPQQRQHFIMFNLLSFAGIIELFLSLKKIKGNLWHFIWPGVLLVIGYMFLTHPQHGTTQSLTYTMPFHTTLGTILIITGVLKAFELRWAKKYKWIAYGWIIFLFVASIMLISYNEPEGSYRMDSSQPAQNQGKMEH